MKRPGMMREHGMHDPEARWHGRGFAARSRRPHGDGAPFPEARGGWRGGHELHHEHGGPADRHRGGHGPRGWRGRGGPKAGRGDVRTATLMLLAEQPLHGYELIQRITERSGGSWRPSPGSIYPALQLLEDQGLIRGEQTDGRRTYQLTEQGNAYMEQHRAELANVWAGVTAGGDDPAHALRDLFEQLGGAVRQVVHAGTDTQIAAAREVLTSARRQLYRLLADDPTGDSSSDTKQS